VTWEAIGAIGEVGGTVAVLATLLLLYRQIKQSSEITKAQIDTMAKDQLAQLTIHPVVTPNLARIIEVGQSQDPSQLTDDEIRSVFWWFTTYGTILEGMFIRWQQDQLDDEMWRGYERILLGALASPLGRRWWRAEMTPFSRRFRAHFDELLASPDTDTSWNVTTPHVEKV
jgi:hypothetical protein